MPTSWIPVELLEVLLLSDTNAAWGTSRLSGTPSCTVSNKKDFSSWTLCLRLNIMVLDDGFQEAGVHGSQNVLRCSQFSIHCLILLIEHQLYITAVNHLCIPVLRELS